jgi:glucans biosynthesis protein
MHRRRFLHAALAGLLGPALGGLGRPAAAQQQAVPAPFSFETVIAAAREAASQPYVRPLMDLEAPFDGLKYDQFRAIRFRDDRRLFADGGRSFQMEMLPPGFSFQDRITINIVRGGQSVPVPFSSDYFEFDPSFFSLPEGRAPEGTEAGMGFSGIRLRYPLNQPGVWDEFAVFQGASYFRAVAHDCIYGLSARGLSIGTGGPDAEEFPIFRAFWVQEPQPGDRAFRVSTLLDSDSVAGAFDFSIVPGVQTVMQVRAVLIPRREINAVGIAPLTSMYYFGPERRAGIDDFRDAVHDSDGLRIVNGSGERLWRPLRNPPGVQVSSFADFNPRAFGLIQRPRDFEHYEDAEAHYEQRPSAWVEPGEGWGKGSVTLVEIPSADEFTDNIVVFWRPEAPLPPDKEYQYTYRLSWAPAQPEELPLAQVHATRSGLSILDPRERLFVVDFDLGMIGFDGITPKLETNAGAVKGVSIDRLPHGNFARVGFHFLPGEAQSAEFRLSLESDGVPASEIWLYRWSA